MDQKQIDRINELARKANPVGLTPEEDAERAELRRLYLAAVKRNLTSQLDHTWVVDEQGNKRKLEKKK